MYAYCLFVIFMRSLLKIYLITPSLSVRPHMKILGNQRSVGLISKYLLSYEQ